MNVFSRGLWIGAWIVIVLSSACNLPAQSPPTLVGTMIPDGQATTTQLPANTLVVTTPTVAIPVTGMNGAVSLQCQFCVNDEARAVLILPEQATFLVSEPVIGVSCLTTQVVNGQRIVFCRGAPQTTFTLNACLDNSNCFQSRITFETCPVIPPAGMSTPQAVSTPSSGLIQAPTQATPLTPLSTATVAPASAPTATALARSPRSGLHDPAGFIHWYFDSVWRNRNYQDLWENYLTASYKANVGSGLYEDYVGWWESVERVEVHSVDVLENDGATAWVRVKATFHMRDGRTVANQAYEYSLFYDANRAAWMFDF